MHSSCYRKAYDTAKRDLAELIAQQEDLEKRKLTLRKTIHALAAQCQAEGVPIDPSEDATQLLENAGLADEIRVILSAHRPGGMRPLSVKRELQRLGHDLSQYGNPQAAIHMVLKRMTASGEVEETTDDDGKKVYQYPDRGTPPTAVTPEPASSVKPAGSRLNDSPAARSVDKPKPSWRD